MAVAVLSDLTPDGVSNLMDSREYLSFVMRLVLAFGLAFLLPVIMVGLNLVGMVRGRTWWGGWRWAVMLSFIFAAMATPSADVISLFALAVPICALYFLAVGLCLLHDRRRDRRERERDAEELAGLSTASGEAPERPARALEPESDA